MKENPAPLSVPAPALSRPAPATQEKHTVPAPLPAQVPELPADTSSGTENSNTQEAEGYTCPLLAVLFSSILHAIF